MTTKRLRVGAIAGAALFLVGACSSAGTSTAPTVGPSVAPSAAESTAPSESAAGSAVDVRLRRAVGPGDRRAGRDPDRRQARLVRRRVSYPPEEFYKADGTTAQGSDVDIANEIGKRFGVTTEIDNTGFDGIIPALCAKKCDLIISGMNDTPSAPAQVDFVDYLKVGQGLLVPAGNPKNITDARGPVRQDGRRPARDDQQGRARCGQHRARGRRASRRSRSRPSSRTPTRSSSSRSAAWTRTRPTRRSCAYYNSRPRASRQVRDRRHADPADPDRHRRPQGRTPT